MNLLSSSVFRWKDVKITEHSRGVAQPGSAPALGAGGRAFKSPRPDQLNERDTPILEAAVKPAVDKIEDAKSSRQCWLVMLSCRTACFSDAIAG
jgi:hypothetical protein